MSTRVHTEPHTGILGSGRGCLSIPPLAHLRGVLASLPISLEGKTQQDSLHPQGPGARGQGWLLCAGESLTGAKQSRYGGVSELMHTPRPSCESTVIHRAC